MDIKERFNGDKIIVVLAGCRRVVRARALAKTVSMPTWASSTSAAGSGQVGKS